MKTTWNARFNDLKAIIEEFKNHPNLNAQLFFMSQERFSVKDTGLSYRAINHWESVGVLTNTRDDDKRWRKFSPIDMVWISIIKELREFGYPLDKIVNLRSQFRLQTKPGLELLEILFWSYIIYIEEFPVVLAVYSDSTYMFLEAGDYQVMLNSLPVLPHILIHMNNIFHDQFDNEFNVNFEDMMAVSEEESEFIGLMREVQNPISIAAVYDDGKIHRYEIKEKRKPKEKVVDILNQSSHQEVKIVRKDGKTVSIESTKRVKPKHKA